MCLLGPTAAGKTAAAMALFDALPVSLISVDSAQVYRGMDIGSAKLEPALLKQYPHALIDIREPENSYSVAEFCRDAGVAIQQAHSTGKIPVLVGGTMMYVQSLMQGLTDLPVADAELRAELEQRAEQNGWPALHAELQQLDPQTAARLKPNDTQRIQRALEVFYASGKPLSAHLNQNSQAEAPWQFLTLAITPNDRKLLHTRIADRVQVMLSGGLIEEVAQLRQRTGLVADSSSMRSVGYRQIWSMLEGDISASELADAIIFSTRQLAKRQLTWLRQMPGTIWVNGIKCGRKKGEDITYEYEFIINRVDIFASNSPLTTV